MTKQNQINELIQILSDNGVHITDMIHTQSEDRQIKLLNKLIRELVA